jgi:hypothetical protein
MRALYTWGFIISGVSFIFCAYLLADQWLDSRFKR